MEMLTPVQLNDMIARGEPVLVIDVRSPAEFTEAHAPFASNQPLPDLNATAIRADIEKTGKRLVFICKSGSRGKAACEKLMAAGLTNVCNVEGGTTGWIEAGLPVVRGGKSFSIEQQTRLVIGSMVLLGVGLGATVHPGFLGIAGFFGAGLVFAALTDSCMLGLMIASMPWNRSKPTCPVR